MNNNQDRRLVNNAIDVVLVLMAVLAIIASIAAIHNERQHNQPTQQPTQPTVARDMVTDTVNDDGSTTYMGTDGFVVTRPAVLDPNRIVGTYTDNSGFSTARLGHESIVVGYAPDFEPDMTVQDKLDWIQPTLDSWNRVAGWELFVSRTEDTPEADIDVRFDLNVEGICPDAGACVTWVFEQDGWNAGGWYLKCDVHFWPWYPYPDVVAHELGHCLGFWDVPDPESTGYFGIMSYGRMFGATPENEQDRNSLIAAGYAE